MTVHRSTAYVKSSQARHHWCKPEPITNQFRFVTRIAYACHDIAECAGRLKVGSIQRRLNAIAEAHKAMGVPASCVPPSRASGVRAGPRRRKRPHAHG